MSEDDDNDDHFNIDQEESSPDKYPSVTEASAATNNSDAYHSPSPRNQGSTNRSPSHELNNHRSTNHCLTDHSAPNTINQTPNKYGHANQRSINQFPAYHNPSDHSPTDHIFIEDNPTNHILCQVCQEKAGKHCYYGGQACISCRAFFRRSVQSASWARYVCTQQKNCEINLKTRKNCQFCRYNACLDAGMKSQWVLNEEEKIKFLRTRKKKHAVTLKCKLLKSLRFISDAEMLEVNDYVKKSEYFEVSKVYDLDTELIRELIR